MILKPGGTNGGIVPLAGDVSISERVGDGASICGPVCGFGGEISEGVDSELFVGGHLWCGLVERL
jgi:hypothetical protein